MEHVRAGAGAHPGWGLSGAKRSNGDRVWSWCGVGGVRGRPLGPGCCARVLGRSGGMPMNFGDRRSGFPGLRFLAMLKAARDLGLDPEAVNAAALR